MHPDTYQPMRQETAGGVLPGGRWMRTPAAALYIWGAESTLEKLRIFGGGPPFVKAGRVVLYDRDDLDRWLAERKVRSTSEPVRAA